FPILCQQQRRICAVRRGSPRNYWRSRNRCHLQACHSRRIPCWTTQVGGSDSFGCGDFPDEVLEKLEPLDQEFFSYPHDLTDLLFAYASEHPEEFGPLPNTVGA